MSHALYETELAETPLPEALRQIGALRTAGVLEARVDDIVKRAALRDGYIVHAASSAPEDWLGSFLLSRGRISEAEHSAIGERSRFSKKVGALLVERGLLEPPEVLEAIRQHTEAIVWSLFSWSRGRIQFRAASLESLGGRVLIQMPLPRVIVEGSRRIPDPRPLLHRLGGREAVLEPSFRTEDLISAGLEPDERKVLEQVDGRRTLVELCTIGPLPPPETARLLFGFRVLDLIRPAGAQRQRSGPIKIRMRTAGDEL